MYEAVLGPEHAEVAHTLTDLAVLHLEQARLRPSRAPRLCACSKCTVLQPSRGSRAHAEAPSGHMHDYGTSTTDEFYATL